MKKNEVLFWVQTVSISLDVSVSYISEKSKFIKIYSENPFYSLLFSKDHDDILNRYLNLVQEKIIYYANTPIKTCYLNICLNKESEEYLVIGPYLNESINESQINELQSNLDIDETILIELKKYYSTMPIVRMDRLWALCNLFLEKYFDIRGPFSVVGIKEEQIMSNKYKLDESLDKNVSIKMIEERYQMENELMDAVSKGDFPSAFMAHEKIMSNLGSYHSFNDSINSGIKGITILNVILRKAAEAGGVHPLYLNDLSSKYSMLSLSKNMDNKISVKMIKDYCSLVKYHSLEGANPLIKRAVSYINLNLDSDLTVTNIANHLCITPNYLSRLFRKENGISVIVYINQKRIDESIRLMKKTDMQIQTIAEKVGINDLSYFSKLFKRQVGKSPTQYRRDLGK
ncbi:AraC family transcriptional regulator [Romboutsia ilealis]|uniref:Helix-turn-helix transcriptional regulator n=1 Tax=Romboutsia faecis TaxID=2764597 RepID=A0ABR7JKV8_9FIRM|nr:AraC family transcriptional regulator [Romboutsia faecis]MBC5995407.1 helix-turn-helix transcriptional regulator [Romboutsia faecis]MRN24351.1 AraC family transcriptional regulator [Romboutsia ilealis]